MSAKFSYGSNLRNAMQTVSLIPLLSTFPSSETGKNCFNQSAKMYGLCVFLNFERNELILIFVRCSLSTGHTAFCPSESETGYRTLLTVLPLPPCVLPGTRQQLQQALRSIILYLPAPPTDPTPFLLLAGKNIPLQK